MGKHIKTQLDYDLIETLAQELHRLDPDNAKLKHYLAMDNFEGGELRKAVTKVRNINSTKNWAEKHRAENAELYASRGTE
jgi:cytochrome c-type biogenesis protein CcmH/NrfG